MVRTGWMIVAVAWLAAGCGGAELPSEDCDDGNHDVGDGCSPLCQVE